MSRSERLETKGRRADGCVKDVVWLRLDLCLACCSVSEKLSRPSFRHVRNSCRRVSVWADFGATATKKRPFFTESLRLSALRTRLYVYIYIQTLCIYAWFEWFWIASFFIFYFFRCVTVSDDSSFERSTRLVPVKESGVADSADAREDGSDSERMDSWIRVFVFTVDSGQSCFFSFPSCFSHESCWKVNVCSGVGNHCARTWGGLQWICQVTSPQRIRPICRNGSISPLCDSAIFIDSHQHYQRGNYRIYLYLWNWFHVIVILAAVYYVCTICGRSQTQTWYATWANQPLIQNGEFYSGARVAPSPKGVVEEVSFKMLIHIASCQRHVVGSLRQGALCVPKKTRMMQSELTVCGQAENVTPADIWYTYRYVYMYIYIYMNSSIWYVYVVNIYIYTYGKKPYETVRHGCLSYILSLDRRRFEDLNLLASELAQGSKLYWRLEATGKSPKSVIS